MVRTYVRMNPGANAGRVLASHRSRRFRRGGSAGKTLLARNAVAAHAPFPLSPNSLRRRCGSRLHRGGGQLCVAEPNVAVVFLLDPSWVVAATTVNDVTRASQAQRSSSGLLGRGP